MMTGTRQQIVREYDGERWAFTWECVGQRYSPGSLQSYFRGVIRKLAETAPEVPDVAEATLPSITRAKQCPRCRLYAVPSDVSMGTIEQWRVFNRCAMCGCSLGRIEQLEEQISHVDHALDELGDSLKPLQQREYREWLMTPFPPTLVEARVQCIAILRRAITRYSRYRRVLRERLRVYLCGEAAK